MPQGKAAALITLSALLAGCAYGTEPTIHGVRDASTGQVVPGLAVVSTGDPGSGPIQSVLLQQRYQRGPFDVLSAHGGPGTFQTFTEGALGAAFIAGGTAGAGALIRPATTVFSNVGNSRATGGSATGGAASARARGGNASAVARQWQSQHQNATATSEAAASTGPVNVNAGGVIPNGTILHTPSGDIRVDPTVSVSQ